MRLLVPDYFNRFKCIADKCRDSCCIGWDMPVDQESIKRYGHIRTDFKSRLMSGITFTDDGACFKRTDDGRCVFLECDGLCEICKALGEGSLCRVCKDHPRYFNLIGDECEGGLGLACEEAARMILALRKAPTAEISECEASPEEINADALTLVREAREKIIKLIFDESVSPTNIMARLDKYGEALDGVLFDVTCGLVSKPSVPEIEDSGCGAEILSAAREWMGVLENIEGLDGWQGLLADAVRASKRDDLEKLISTGADGYARALLYYFVHRYLICAAVDGDIMPRIRLAILSCVFICAVMLWRADTSLEGASTIAKDYSKSVEYSTDNIELLLSSL